MWMLASDADPVIFDSLFSGGALAIVSGFFLWLSNRFIQHVERRDDQMAVQMDKRDAHMASQMEKSDKRWSEISESHRRTTDQAIHTMMDVNRSLADHTNILSRHVQSIEKISTQSSKPPSVDTDDHTRY